MKKLLFSIVLAVLGGPADAALEITISGGGTGTQPIAVVPFSASAEFGTDLAAIVEADLGRSGLFAPLPRADMLEQPREASQVNYRNWRMVNVEALVVGQVTRDPTGAYAVMFQLLDVFRGDLIAGFEVPVVNPAKPRPTAHQIADIVYEKLTGIRGYFNTRIAYVTASGYTPATRLYQLVVADAADGENAQIVASSRDPLMSPAWAPDGRRLAYVSYERGSSAIYIHDLETGQARKLVGEKGINGAPAWSPDGRSLAVTLSFSVNPDIYIIDVATGTKRRLTDARGIETESAWSPDGSEIAFTSDRGGQPQIYAVSSAGGEARRVTFEGRQNLRPRYSPDGKYMTLVNYDDSRYRVGLLDLKTRALRVVSDGPLDESPSFAPNGALIIYSTTSKQGIELATVTVDGRVRQRLKQVGDVREPAWSPFLK
jgi:TolB protein